MRILLAGLLWLPLLVLVELSTKELVTLLTEAASFSHDSFRSDTCQIGKCGIYLDESIFIMTVHRCHNCNLYFLLLLCFYSTDQQVLLDIYHLS